ncbi:GNAT family N-acetyltransferase [Amycolatopsis thailandensis]|uniref:GNAT family N-acetyltransferase n=1 Tax=Amycolatopsis thailandensis TaxID=589330 RepID=UPI001FC9484F|nr:GNAT family N-acetyltransferase [Amycolatopsis thailandensis]
MTEPLSWPATPPAHGSVVLREFTETDASLALELGEDPYIPLIGSLPAHPTPREAEDWVLRQRSRHTEGRGFPFVITVDGIAVGTIGLWLRKLSEGIGILGYSVSPRHRRRGVATDALKAITGFARPSPLSSGSSWPSSRGTAAPFARPKKRATGAKACCPLITRSAGSRGTCSSTCRREPRASTGTKSHPRVRPPCSSSTTPWA